MQKRLNQIINALVFAIPFLVYLFTLFPTVTSEDSGELITASFHLDIAHPPGYPLYIILGKIFSTILFFGNIAWRYNVFSALLSATTILILHLTIKKILSKSTNSKSQSNSKTSTPTPLLNHSTTLTNQLISAAIVLFFAFTQIFWSQAIRAEVYALNSLFLAGIIYLSYAWYTNPSKKNLIYTLALTLGLAATNHQIIILIGPALAILIILKNHSLFKQPKFWFKSIAAFLIGLSVYSWIFIIDPSQSVVRWSQQKSVDASIEHITRHNYNEGSPEYTTVEDTNLTRIPGQKYLAVTKLFNQNIFKQGFYILPLLILVPFLRLFRRKEKDPNRKFTIFLFTGLIFNILPYAHFLRIHNHISNFPFYIPALIIITILAAQGLAYLIKQLPKKLAPYSTIPLVLLLILVPLINNFTPNNQSKNYIAHDIAKASLRYLPENSKLFINDTDDFLFPILYLQEVENFRKDIQIINTPASILETYPKYKSWLTEAVKSPNRIFSQKHNEQPVDFFYAHTTPFALEMISFDKYTPETIAGEKEQIAIFESTPIRGLNEVYLDQRHKRLVSHYYFNRGRLSINQNPNESERYFAKAIEIAQKDEEPSFYFHYYIAHMYNHNFQYPAAIKHIKQAIKIRPQQFLTNYLKSLIQKSNQQ